MAPDPIIVAVLGLAAGLYLAGWRRRPRTGRTSTRLREVAFSAGMVALVVALASPLDALAERMFSAHMLQHLLLGVVAPPLLVLGCTARTITWALPNRWRRRAARLHGMVVRRARRTAWLPVVALAGYTLTWWAWHVPALYEAAIAHPLVHVIEHATMLGVGLALAAPVVHPARTAQWTGLLLLLGAAMQSGVLATLLTFATEPWYRLGVPVIALTPLEDQQLGGAMMWVLGGMVYLFAAAASFVRWLRREEQAGDRADARQWKDVGYAG